MTFIKVDDRERRLLFVRDPGTNGLNIYHTFSRHLALQEVCESVRYVIVRNTSTLWQFGTTRN
jgi:hypothetical protein